MTPFPNDSPVTPEQSHQLRHICLLSSRSHLSHSSLRRSNSERIESNFHQYSPLRVRKIRRRDASSSDISPFRTYGSQIRYRYSPLSNSRRIGSSDSSNNSPFSSRVSSGNPPTLLQEDQVRRASSPLRSGFPDLRPSDSSTSLSSSGSNLQSPPSSPVFTSPRSTDSSPCFSPSAADETFNSSCESSPEDVKTRLIPAQIPHFKPLFGKKLGNTRRLLLPALLTEQPQVKKVPPSSQIFAIPEILSLIIKNVGRDDERKSSHMKHVIQPVKRTIPYKHPALIHVSERGWSRSISNSSISSAMNPKHCKNYTSSNLYSCMLVNRLWLAVTREIINENVFFQSDTDFQKFSISSSCRDIHCKTFVLHKLRMIRQTQVNAVAARTNPINLKWIEFYICPRIIPPISLFTKSMIKLSLPGCRCLSDEDLVAIVQRTPNLRTLDLRACEMITDASLYQVAQCCPQLETLNVGRHLKGDLVSDYSICPIVRKCQLKTIGIAGCGITDRTIWELGLLRGDQLERLSINHCARLGDFGLCQALRRDVFKSLSVLEIRGLNLTDFRALVEFKKRQIKRNVTVLIEACDYLQSKMKETELQMDLEISNRIFSDIADWLNEDEDDDDRNYALFRQRRAAHQHQKNHSGSTPNMIGSRDTALN